MPMEEIKRIADQLQRAFQGEAWHGPSVVDLLADVTAKRALAKPVKGVHSIWEVVLHITAWEKTVQRRTKGETVEPSAEQDWPLIADDSPEAWNETMALLEKTHEELLQQVNHFPASKLEEPVSGQNYTFYFMFHGIIQHTLYHGGQIAVLKKASIRSGTPGKMRKKRKRARGKKG
jgi:uncharacterized damage-inducible protein DinB